MKIKVIFIGVLFLLLLVPRVILAQFTFSFSDYFDQFYNNYYLLNPANSDSTYKIAANVSNKTQTGLFQGVNKIYMDVDLRLSGRRDISNFLGIQVVNNKEGEFINKSRLVGRYSFRAKISYRSSLSAGVSLGFVNYAFNTSQSGTGGSAWAPDGNAGIWYLRKKLSVGFSMQQIFSQTLHPVNQTYFLTNYYIITAKYCLQLSRSLTINNHFYSKFQKDQSMYFVLASLFEFQEKFDAGVSYSYRRGLSYVVGVKKLGIGKSRFSFYFSYFVGASKINVNDNAFELLVSYHR
jgi:type IX secretion system PorP/SprF family membrane protein